MKQPPCTLGKKHTWEFVKNITLITQTINTTNYRFRGKYRCKCGATKVGREGEELKK